jgi:hypothetical protein
VQFYQGKPAPSHDIKRIAVLFEQKMFTEAGSKVGVSIPVVPSLTCQLRAEDFSFQICIYLHVTDEVIIW